MSILSYSNFGYEGAIVKVETELRRGIPAVDIVGLADNSVKESRERMKCVIQNSGFEFPQERVLISLSPADLKKEGAGFDLPIALSILHTYAESKGEVTHSQDNKVLVIGELELSGKIRPVCGVFSALQTAIYEGVKYAIIPKDSEEVPNGILCYRADTLEDAYYALCKVDCEDTEEYFQELVDGQKEESFKVEFEDYDFAEEFDQIENHNGLKMALAVAVAGRHNLMVWGSPGSGKTLVLQKMPLLMPKLLPEQKTSVNRIWSIAGLLRNGAKITNRPFRMPHQTASIEGICGGGINCRPGEITLAHHGVLFLDEAAEFRSSVLQMLRVPLECETITLSRAGRSTTYPAKFQLIMATNPCPCGNYGQPEKICLCSSRSIDLYWKKFSAPLLDRIGIRFDNSSESKEDYEYRSLASLRLMIKQAWERQYARQHKLNQDLAPEEVLENIKLSEDAQKKLDEEIEIRGLSPRAVTNIIKIAKTIGDMLDRDEQKTVSTFHIDYALKLHGVIPAENLF